MTTPSAEPLSLSPPRSGARAWFTPALLTLAFLAVIVTAEWLTYWQGDGAPSGGGLAGHALAGLAASLALGMGYSLWRLKTDVAAHERAEERIRQAGRELEASERRLTFALEQSHTGGWDLDLVDHTAFRTVQHDRIFGYDALLPEWTYEMFLEHVLPEDRAAVDRAFTQATATGTNWSFECRIRRIDGDVRWIWAAGGHQRDGQGSARRMAGIVQDITERKAIEAALRESEERLRRLGDNLPESYVYQYTLEDDGTPRFPYVSAGVERVHGVTPEQVVRDAGALLGQILPDQMPALVEDERLSQEALSDFDSELPIRNAAGEERWLRFRSRPRRLESGRVIWDGVATDITSRRRIEEERRQERAFTDAVLDSLPGVVYCYDEAFRFRRWNAQFVRVTGYSNDEIAIMSPLDFFTDADRALVADRIGRVFSTGLAEVEAGFRAKDGSTTPYYFTGRAAWIEGRAHLVGVGIDVSSRRQAEEKVRHLHEELRRHAEDLERRVAARTAELEVARDRAEAADRLKSAFLATMSHELRTPLNSIIGFTGILLQQLPGPLNDEQLRQLGMVRNSSRHLLDLINDVLDLTKIEAGQLQVHDESFDLHASVQRVTATVRPMAEAKGLALAEDLAPGVRVVSDRRRVEQILLNLLNNAIKFTDAGSIAVRLRTDDGAVRVAVSDTGVGIAPDDVAKVFEPFRQIDSGITRRHEGTGLGLAICRRLAKMLRSDITVESVPGAGSTFTLVLPPGPPGDWHA